MRKIVTWEEHCVPSRWVIMLLLIYWYFCIVPPLRHGITKKKRGLSIILIVRLLFDRYPHTEGLPVAVPPQQFILDSDDEPTENREKTPRPSKSMDADFTANLQLNEFHRITQEELNDLIRDLDW